ncbi:UNVERIFIED_CONTAM: hypothetical protein PYX00_006421 [Menopon gallinae]|uniref:Cuticle protein 6 n=1 Tax=Menopon gallinae TaxID=328185 RepID=A0AAW2HWU2_9NEOP
MFKKPPKYEYGYIVSDQEGNAQGHVESRDGVYALGRYYVNSPSGSGQKVTYFADDWGYHPLVSYASTSPRGSSRTQFAMGDKAIAALKDNAPVGNGIEAKDTSFTSVGLAAAAQHPSLLLVPPTLSTGNYAPSENPSSTIGTAIVGTPITAGKQTILHLPNLRETLRNNTDPGPTVQQERQQIVKLSAYLQPPENISSSYNTDIQPPTEQLTEEQHQNLYASPSEVYLTTTMKPIVVSVTENNNIITNNNGESGYNNVENTDSATQSTNSVLVDEGRNAIDQLAPLQAGLSILSSESAKPVQESVEAEPVSYKTVVDIQEGISVDVRQNPDGSLRLANFGDKIPKQNIQALGYERRLVDPAAQSVVRENDPVLREQKQADLLARQEAEILAVQKSIEQLQQQIISQIDEEHAKVETKQESEKPEALTQDQNSIQSSNTPVHVAPREEYPEAPAAVQPVVLAPVPVPEENIPVSYADVQVDRESVGNNQIEALPHRTVKSQNLAGILTLNAPPPPTAQALIQEPQSAETVDLVPPPVESEPVLVEPYPVEEEPKLLPAPAPTLFPVKVETPVIVEKPTIVETTKVVEKPVVVKEPVEYTKVVEVEKPVPVLQPYPVEVTKVVHVDRPVPVPHPIAVSHPVPVPVAVPHPVEVPVPHLIPVPEILPIALKEYYPVYIHKSKPKQPRKPIPEKLFTPETSASGVTFQPEAVARPAFHEPLHHVIDWQTYVSQQQFSEEALRQAYRSNRGHRNKNVLKNLRIEYGFKPPLRPSVEITEEVKPSIYGPSYRSD